MTTFREALLDTELRAAAKHHWEHASSMYCGYVIAQFLRNGVGLLIVAALYRHAPRFWGDAFVLVCLLTAAWRVVRDTAAFGETPKAALAALVEDDGRAVVRPAAAVRREYIRRAMRSIGCAAVEKHGCAAACSVADPTTRSLADVAMAFEEDASE